MQLDIQDYDLRDIVDLFDVVNRNEEAFQNKHNTFIDISQKFIKYYLENANELHLMMHPSASHTFMEEDWACVETGNA